MLAIPDSMMPHVRRFGFSGLFVLGIVVFMMFGINPVTVLTGQRAEPHPLTAQTGLEALRAGEATPADYLEAVERGARGYWQRSFQQAGIRYRDPEMVMVRAGTPFGCGLGGSGLTAYYCIEDRRIYVDMALYGLMRAQHPEEADLVQGYLLARAYGHHVQNELGLFERFAVARPAMAEDQARREAQRITAQAACHAGIWTKFAGFEPLLDDPAMVAVIERFGTPRPGVRAEAVPETLPQPDPGFRKAWFDAGYAIPAGGSCRIERIAPPA